MKLRPLAVCLAAVWLVGCQGLPPMREPPTVTTSMPAPNAPPSCHASVPDFDDPACLVPDWVAFGLAAQRGDGAWRQSMLQRLAGDATEQRLARAVVLAWGSEAQWYQASELFKADLHAAPPRLQPLLRYWLNEVERRRALAGRLASSRDELAAMSAEKDALTEKLEALTAIEQNINSRQQTE